MSALLPCRPVWRVFVAVLVLILAVWSGAWSADGYSINNGATQQIIEHSVCRKVTNAIAGGTGLYVPTKYDFEWNNGTKAFLNNIISGVSLAACLDAASLRFKGNAYLSRVATAGDSKIFTWSAWVKRNGNFGVAQDLFGGYLNASNFTIISIDTSNMIQYYNLNSANGRAWVASSGVLRDPSAWYHVVVSINANTGYGKVYINGVEQTSLPLAPLNYTSSINTAGHTQVVGIRGDGTSYFHGYMADMYLIDGQALPPSAFGEADPDTGQWIPKAYSGTYGTNGVHLTFANTASLGNDTSGGAKHWTPNNFSTTAGNTYDPSLDYSSGSFGGNAITWNPLDKRTTAPLSEGNLRAVGGAINVLWQAYSTQILPRTGKWYWETTTAPTAYGNGQSGLMSADNASVYVLHVPGAGTYKNGVLADATTGFHSGQVNTYGYAYDANAGKLWVRSHVGTWIASKDPAVDTTGLVSAITPADYFLVWQANSGAEANLYGILNAGQRAFAYAVPTGFNRLNTYNLPTPAIVTPTAYFKTVTYTGNGTYQSIGTPPKLSGGSNISNSLRFRRENNAYLSRTWPGTPGNMRTWTWSGWVKRSSLGTDQFLFATPDNNLSSGNYAAIRFDNTDSLNVFSYASAYQLNLQPSQLPRDPSRWMHVVVAIDTTQAVTADRAKIYLDGRQVTSFFAATYPAQNASLMVNNFATIHQIGAHRNTVTGVNHFFSGYMSDVYFVDGQAHAATAFGQFSSEGVWVPKAYTGTYGTNGFHLTFNEKSNTTAGTLGADSSGNGNNWTPNGFSVTAGATDDVLRDAPSDYADVHGDHGNFATLNPHAQNGASGSFYLSEGNLAMTVTNNSGYRNFSATVSPEGQKGYFEFAMTTGAPNFKLGFEDTTKAFNYLGYQSAGTFALANDGTVYNGLSSVYATVAAPSVGDVLMVAFDFTNGARNVWFGRNGTWGNGPGGAGNPATGANPVLTSATLTSTYRLYFASNTGGGATVNTVNFGQRPFAYTPPAGFKTLSTVNISPSGFVPDLVWIKGRSGATDHALYDTARGATLDLVTNSTAAETVQSTGLLGFNAGGFNLGSLAKLNTSGATYVAWMFKKGMTPGFDVVTYAGTGSARTVAHSLGAVPKMIVVKNRTAAGQPWHIYTAMGGNTNALFFDTQALTAGGSAWWNSTDPTSSAFSLNTSGGVNASGQNLVAYLFAEVPGFSKFGSYTGNGSADGPFVYTGFKPAFVMIKRTDAADSWIMVDAARQTYNVLGPYSLANSSGAEASTPFIDFLANGFKIRNASNSTNASGATYIYAAFAEQPFKYATAR